MESAPDYVHAPFSTPLDHFNPNDIIIWACNSVAYAEDCYLLKSTPKTLEELQEDAIARCKHIIRYGRKDGISFGSFDTNVFYQPAINSTTAVTPSYVYDDRCTSFEIKFGDLESNETNHQYPSSSRFLEQKQYSIYRRLMTYQSAQGKVGQDVALCVWC